MLDDPYEVLGVAADADEEVVRSRYLELVRQYPPDRDPARFARIRAAYDRLRDPVANLEQRLFSCRAGDTLESLQAGLAQRSAARIPTRVLLSLADD